MKKEDSNIFFIIGSQRSGTTLLRLILDSHKDIVVYDEDIAYEMLEKQDFTSDKNKIIGFKVPVLTSDYEILQNRYPDSRFIFMKRNLKGIINSMLNLEIDGKLWTNLYCDREIRRDIQAISSNEIRDFFLKEYEDTSDDRIKITSLCAFIKNSLFEEYKQRSIRFLEVNYEDLVTDKKKTIAEILKFLDLEWDAKVLKHSQYHEGIQIGNTDAKREIDDRSLDRWQTDLSETSKKKISDYLKYLTDRIKEINYQELLETPFDQYGRYMYLVQIAEKIRKDMPLNILDVGGGGQRVLERFLPDDTIITLDLDKYDFRGFIQGDALNMPFEDKTFDIVVCNDMIEHIPDQKRKKLLEELKRVSKDTIFVAAPFNTKKNLESEKEIIKYQELIGVEDRWLYEHQENGLPEEDIITSFFKDKEYVVQRIMNNSHLFWSKLIKEYFFFHSLNGLDNYKLISEYYNKNIAPFDFDDDSYRTIFIISKNEEKITLKKKKDLSIFKADLDRLIDENKIKCILRLKEEFEKAKVLETKTDTLDKYQELEKEFLKLKKINTELNKEILKKDEDIKKNQLKIDSLQNQVEVSQFELYDIKNSKAWKIIQGYRKGKAIVNNLSGIFKKTSVDELRRSVKKTRNTILLFPIIDWDFRFQRPQQLASLMAQDNTVIYFKTTVIKIDTILVSENPDHILYNVGVEKVKDNIYVVNLVSGTRLNIYKDVLKDNDAELMLDAINRLKQLLGIKSTISIVNLPFWYPLVKKIDANKIIYDCMDEHSGFTDISSDIADVEKDLIKSSDHLIVSSNRLYDKNKHLNKNIHLIKNAVDFDHFTSNIQTRLKKYDKPIIGYYGAICDWFDVELVEKIAREFKDASIVLIGSTAGCLEIDHLKNKKNIYLLGEKPYDEIPSYLNDFDVAIIPFKINELTKATNPVKFYEYMSQGKPMVSTDLPELYEYGRFVYLSKTHDEFIRNIQTALQNKDKDKNKKIEFARKQTWKERYKELKKVLQAV